ncbi:MAG: hypothetical protein Tsb0034_06030 [Ekhidna sp.]
MIKTIQSSSLRTGLFILGALLLMVRCSKDEEGIACCVEPVGSAAYYFTNQTSEDIMVEFTLSEELGRQVVDTLPPLEGESTTLILTDGIIGVNPLPSNSFSEIRVYSIGDSQHPLKTISPIKNEDWNVVSSERNESGYGLTEYEYRFEMP